MKNRNTAIHNTACPTNLISRIQNNHMMKMTIPLATFCFIIFFSVALYSFQAKAGAENEVKYKYYKCIEIEDGDTLWSIADQYMDSSIDTKLSYISEVKSINHIQDGNEIMAGKMLIVPYYSYDYIIQ